ncbi:competence type IV pilus minor pilin ComGG [Sporolactobacillus inulinus]|uniref:Competence protein ComG n=2 Tax=Sporolactobacillus inulinus TaxID=2078 RepID=A0A4Y3T6Z3_9BACL|nr:competence type IV pilus minor pilin ComGG [Sporolactobacillus inulinus]KLI02584.1 hypothetical protein SINU_07145 [Sporolactobacillus inulinus CASD]GAY75290.1 hypothetical protein NBRC111894_844 [Sporolactobacillus inulinus]GEB76690.1 hypothetical protein SIN01_10350 [Sporolactobacillus inulinus]
MKSKPLNNQQGFILPLVMILSLVLITFIFHALFLLQSDRTFFQHAQTHFVLQQLRECALNDFQQKLQQGDLPHEGSFNYHKGTVQYIVTEDSAFVTINFTVQYGDEREIDRIVYDRESGNPVRWLERIS